MPVGRSDAAKELVALKQVRALLLDEAKLEKDAHSATTERLKAAEARLAEIDRSAQCKAAAHTRELELERREAKVFRLRAIAAEASVELFEAERSEAGHAAAAREIETLTAELNGERERAADDRGEFATALDAERRRVGELSSAAESAASTMREALQQRTAEATKLASDLDAARTEAIQAVETAGAVPNLVHQLASVEASLAAVNEARVADRIEADARCALLQKAAEDAERHATELEDAHATFIAESAAVYDTEHAAAAARCADLERAITEAAERAVAVQAEHAAQLAVITAAAEEKHDAVVAQRTQLEQALCDVTKRSEQLAAEHAAHLVTSEKTAGKEIGDAAARCADLERDLAGAVQRAAQVEADHASALAEIAATAEERGLAATKAATEASAVLEATRQIAQLTSEKDAATRALEAAQQGFIAANRASEAALRQSHVTLEASQRESIAARDEFEADLEDLRRKLAASTEKRRELEKENQRVVGLQRGAMASAAPAQGSRRPPPAVRPVAAAAAPVARAPPVQHGATFRVENCHVQEMNGNYTKIKGKPEYRNGNDCIISQNGGCWVADWGDYMCDWRGYHPDRSATRPPRTGWLNTDGSPSPMVIVYL
jgi:hypothetical protein